MVVSYSFTSAALCATSLSPVVGREDTEATCTLKANSQGSTFTVRAAGVGGVSTNNHQLTYCRLAGRGEGGRLASGDGKRSAEVWTWEWEGGARAFVSLL